MGSAPVGDSDAVAYNLTVNACKEHRLILAGCYRFFWNMGTVTENVTSLHSELKNRLKCSMYLAMIAQ